MNPLFDCEQRKVSMIEVKVQKGNGVSSICLREDESLMDALLREGYYISAVCGGNGHCGKCKVCVLEGDAPVASEDSRVFSEKELEEGWRLSCKLYPTERIKISFELNDESDFEVISSHKEFHDIISGEKESSDTEEYEVAIDIGTTTIAFELLDKCTGEVKNVATRINSQRKYGADVISRIEASVNGKGEVLRKCIRKDLREGIQTLLSGCHARKEQIVRIAIGGNTTMGHLLMGYDCSGLGVYPFKPVDIGFITGSMEEILGMPGEAEVILLPGISTYVGGDIASGLYACDFGSSDQVCLLVDLGTNGEMALGNGERILVTSTAAGPAFEGGNIACGMGSVAGAICSVKIEDEKAQIQTIGNKDPVGICGTGVVETVAELVRTELIDETGLLEDDYFEDGFPLAHTAAGEDIVFTQKDIREIQLAKAAVRAGIETLILRYGIQKEQIAKVYLAGGFGYRIDTKKAIAIGMLPREFDGRIEAVGNSSLAGAEKYLKEVRGAEDLQEIVWKSEEVELSSDLDFNQFYVESMMFEE